MRSEKECWAHFFTPFWSGLLGFGQVWSGCSFAETEEGRQSGRQSRVWCKTNSERKKGWNWLTQVLVFPSRQSNPGGVARSRRSNATRRWSCGDSVRAYIGYTARTAPTRHGKSSGETLRAIEVGGRDRGKSDKESGNP